MKKGLKKYIWADFDKKREKDVRELKKMIADFRMKVDRMSRRFEMRRNG